MSAGPLLAPILGPILGLLGISLSWLGAGLFVLSDGRRGIAAGIFIAAVGLGLTQEADQRPLAGLIVTAGGVLGALAALGGEDRPGWGVLPAGSTSRIVLSVVLGAAALWLGSGLLTVPGGWQVRAAASIVMALAGARALVGTQISVAMGAASLVVLAAGGVAGHGGGGLEAGLLASAGAVVLNLLPRAFRAERAADRGMSDG
ncbi:MAG: hypothetical protein M3010_10570 [Candidatus Dormibacteraeota bacterium]|nr:hypothetical protein [Candidatus Dormibacteraeota bacterium]